MGAQINENSIRLNNSSTRNLMIIIIIACLVIDVILLYFASLDSNNFAEFFHLLLDDPRYIGLILVPTTGVVYLLATKRYTIKLDASGIFCSSFNGENDVKILWSQVDHIEHDTDWVIFHFNHRDQPLRLTPINFILSNGPEQVKDLTTEIVTFTKKYVKSNDHKTELSQ